MPAIPAKPAEPRAASPRDEIVFVYPNYENAVYQGCSHHYGAASVRAVLAERQIASSMLLSGRDAGIRQIAERVVESGSPVVGLTCYDENYYLVSLLTRALRERDPRLKIVVGGPTATFSDAWMAENNPQIDVVVRGEAEETLPGLIPLLVDGEDFRSLPGITFLDGERAVRNPAAPLVGSRTKGAELDVIPSPYVSGFLPPERIDEIGLQTSRGCVYRCSFCNFTIISQNRVRYFSVDRVLEELAFIAERLPARLALPVPIFDDFFSLNLKRVKKILQGMIDLGLQHKLRFLCETRADAVDREFFSLLRQAGCQAINFGLESGVPQVLRHAKKLSFGKRPDFQAEERFLGRVRQSVAWAREEGLGVSVTVILGLPGEGYEEGKATIDFVDELGCDTYGHNFLQVFPGTELFHRHEEWGIRVEPSATGLPYITHPAYNVADVPFLRHGTVPSLWLERNKVLADFFTGLPSAAGPPSTAGRAPVTRLDMGPRLDHGGLGAWIGPASEVLLDHSEAAEPPDLKDDFRQIVGHGYPLIRALVMEGANGLRTVRDVNRGAAQHLNFASRVRPLAFKDLDPAAAPEDDDGVNQTLYVLSLGDREDLDAFGRALTRLEEERSATFSLGWLNHTLLLKDACRWGGAACAGAGGERRWMLSGGEVFPCFDGDAVGTVAAGPEAARRRLAERAASAAEARGCAGCAVEDSCSGCAFPFPFASDVDYCTFRRAHPMAPVFERLLRVKNAFVRSRTRVVAEKNTREGACRIKVDLGWPRPLLFDPVELDPAADPHAWGGEAPPWAERVEASAFAREAYLVSALGKAYLVLPETLATVELSPALAEIWEALAMRVGPRSMERHFRRKFDLSAETWRENFSSALSIFDDLGFFGDGASAGRLGEPMENFFLRNTLTG
jgi:radical SAM superfamily enzyme YgiQ (UPF0313 family)